MMKWVFTLWLVFIPTMAWAIGLSQTPTNLNVVYTEPTTSQDGSPLTDLESTNIVVEENGAILFDLIITATSPTGGGAINEVVPVNVAVGEDRTFDVTVTAKDLSQNVSLPVSATIIFDRLAPGPVKD